LPILDLASILTVPAFGITSGDPRTFGVALADNHLPSGESLNTDLNFSWTVLG
jgi:hypothetical protein